MKLLKISSISFFVLFSLLLSTGVSAVETTTAPAPAQKAVVVATVNLQNAKIISQEGNVFNISFNITNREGAQSGMMYSVKLLQKTDKTQTIADEYVYPEVFSIGANATQEKSIVYTAPASLDGTYTMIVSIKNYNGLPLGTGSLGDIKLVSSIKTIEILPETCVISTFADKNVSSTPLAKGVSISPKDSILLTCTIINNSKEALTGTPVYETHYRTIFGDVVEQTGGDVTPITLKSGEKKIVSLAIPKATAPQNYTLKFSLKSGDVYSNSVFVNYNLSGLSATIQNFSLDKDLYQKGETAKISFFWTMLANKENNSTITLDAKITDERGKDCVDPISQVLTKTGLVEIPALITKDCKNPQVSITLKDASGNVLDQKDLSFKSTISPTQNIFAGKNSILIIIVILIVLGLAMYFIKRKKKENNIDGGPTNTTGNVGGPTLAMFFFILMFGLTLIPGGVVKADTFYITNGYGTVFLDISLNSSTDTTGSEAIAFNYGDLITLNSSIYYDRYGSASTMRLDASKDDDIQRIEFEGQTIIVGGDTLYAQNTFYSSPAIASGDVYVSGRIYIDGIYAVDVNCPLPYTVNPPTILLKTPRVTVYAKSTETQEESASQITVNAIPQNVEIYWSSQNATSCTCTFSGGDCTPPKPLPSARSNPPIDAQGSPFTLASTSTFNVVCNNNPQ